MALKFFTPVSQNVCTTLHPKQRPLYSKNVLKTWPSFSERCVKQIFDIPIVLIFSSVTPPWATKCVP